MNSKAKMFIELFNRAVRVRRLGLFALRLGRVLGLVRVDALLLVHILALLAFFLLIGTLGCASLLALLAHGLAVKARLQTLLALLGVIL